MFNTWIATLAHETSIDCIFDWMLVCGLWNYLLITFAQISFLTLPVSCATSCPFSYVHTGSRWMKGFSYLSFEAELSIFHFISKYLRYNTSFTLITTSFSLYFCKYKYDRIGSLLILNWNCSGEKVCFFRAGAILPLS